MAGTTIKPDLSVSLERCEEALRLVLNSQAFARAEKLQRFLQFVAESTFRGDAGQIHEHLIAVQVFGRGHDYSPAEDSVVRRQAHALRRKLRDYYDSEGKADPVQIELPLGSYVPAFRERRETAALVADPQPSITISPAPAEAPVRLARPPLLLGALLTAIVLFASGWAVKALQVRTSTAIPGAELRELWGPWLTDTNGAVLCFSNPPSTSVRQFARPLQPNPEHQGISVTGQQDAALRRFFHFEDGGNIYLYPLAAQAKMGEALASVSLTAFFTKANLPVKATQSRFVTWETLREQNVILLGHADSNQWVEPILKPSPFILIPTDPQHRARIRNRSPLPGEQAEYFPTLPDETKSYALVSMLAGVDGSHQVLVIGGLDTSSTTAAAEYLVEPDTASHLLEQLRAASPGHRGPWRFQVILETDVRDTVALRAFPVALRVL